VDLVLDYDKRVGDGFVDGELRQGQGARPVLLDAGGDTRLRRVREEAARLLEGIVGVRAKAKVLALIVSDRMGGSHPAMLRYREPGATRTSLTLGGTERSSSPKGERSLQPPMLVGSIVEGMAWHRALLFKYLCDMEGIGLPCCLMRSFDASGREIRAWNVVALGPAVDGKGSMWAVVSL
jgi:hypothetical protein